MNTVVTCLLTSVPDPQRGERLPSSVDTIRALMDSVHAHGRHLTVLHDCLDVPDDRLTTFRRVEPGDNPYWHRWKVIADLLADARGLVWCVDGTDVEMLHDPFPAMRRGVLYVGSEQKWLGDDIPAVAWLRESCPSIGGWLGENPTLPMVNPGTVGGDAATVRELAEALTAGRTPDPWEMGLFQRVVHSWPGGFVTGQQVHTPFGHEQRAGRSWWRHK